MKRLIPLLVLAAALAVPALAAAASPPSSVVLKVDRASKLVAVTGARGRVALVHTAAASRLRVGQRVALKARTLRNGTLASSSVRVVGRARSARIHAVVLAHRKGRLVVSAGGAVLNLKMRRAARSTASAADTTQPPVGSGVQVTVDVQNSQLTASGVTVVDQNAPGGKIEGRLTIGTGTVTISDDGLSLRFAVPAGFDLSKFKNGQEVLAVFTQNADGTLTLVKLSGDDDEDEADDKSKSESDDDDDDDDDEDDD